MFRSGGGFAACFVVAVQSACGLERVELGGFGTALPAEEPQPAPPNDASSGPVGAEPSSSAGPSGFDVLSGQLPGCEKADFLFVIDNSQSMELAQDNLRNSFSGFLGVLNETLETNDFHIMVVDSDGVIDAAGGGDVADAGSLATRCDAVLGAGRRLNGASGEECQLLPGQRYLTVGQPAFDSAFECLATVGTQGNDREQQAGALLSATSSELNDPGGCNEGFLRRDAILVVTIITNTDDAVSPDDPPVWYDELVARKNGNEASIVMLGFFPGGGAGAFQPNTAGLACNIFAVINRAPRLESLVDRFSHRSVASVCQASYAPAFEAAVSSIDLACDTFVPPAIQ
jgi:hypothetical protein